MAEFNSRADKVRHLVANRRTQKNRKAQAYVTSGVREVSTNEVSSEDHERSKRLKAFLERRRNDPDHVRKQIEKRKAKYGLTGNVAAFPSK